jgi:PAS domain S-box-containing protein
LPAQREIEELLQFIYLMPVAVVRMGETGAVELLNPKAVQLLQDLDIDAGSGDGCLILESLCPGLQQAWLDSAGRLGAVVPARRISSVRAGRQPLHLVLELTRPDARCTMLLLEDVTVVVEQERELSRARRRMDLALEHIHGCCVLMLDVRGNVMESNPSISRMFGGTEADIVGHSVLRPITFDETSRGPALDFETISLAVGRQGWCNLESRWGGFEGHQFWGECMVTAVVDPDGATSGYVAVNRDTTKEHDRSQKLLNDAWTDPLIGLYNRRGFEGRAEALSSRESGASPRQTWIMIDIDH